MASHGKEVALIIGASRGIGRQVAIDLAKNGYYVVVSAKTTSDASAIPASQFPPNPNTHASTINTVAREITEMGGSVLALPVNTRDHASIDKLVNDTVARLGRIDVIIYNSGAIWFNTLEETPLKRFKLMQEVNAEGLYSVLQSAFPQIKKQNYKCRIIVVSPPIYDRMIDNKTAYAMSKLSMTILTIGLAKEIRQQGHTDFAVTSIWPAVAIESAATELNAQVRANSMDSTSAEGRRELRKPSIYSDAILAMIRAPADRVNGLVDTDEDFLRRECGFTDADLERYSIVPGSRPRRLLPRKLPSLKAEDDGDGPPRGAKL